MGEQAMSAGHIHDTAAAAMSPNPPGDFPGLEQFLAWQPSDAADDATDAVEQRVAREATHVVMGEAALRAVREAHACIVMKWHPQDPTEHLPRGAASQPATKATRRIATKVIFTKATKAGNARVAVGRRPHIACDQLTNSRRARNRCVDDTRRPAKQAGVARFPFRTE